MLRIISEKKILFQNKFFFNFHFKYIRYFLENIFTNIIIRICANTNTRSLFLTCCFSKKFLIVLVEKKKFFLIYPHFPRICTFFAFSSRIFITFNTNTFSRVLQHLNISVGSFNYPISFQHFLVFVSYFNTVHPIFHYHYFLI